jgi:hypothetical protein
VTVGADGLQPPAANMRIFVSNILLALHQCVNNYSNTGFYCKWRSAPRIPHCILILQIMEIRRNIGIRQRRNYLKERYKYVSGKAIRYRQTDRHKKRCSAKCRKSLGKIASRSVAAVSSHCTALWCTYRKICTNMSFLSHVFQKLRYDQT